MLPSLALFCFSLHPVLLFLCPLARWIDASKWVGRASGGGRETHKAEVENSRSTVPAALRLKYPDLPCVVVSGLPFQKTVDGI